MKNKNKKARSNNVGRTIAVIIIETIFMATAWTVCALAPMPWNIVVPITIGIRGIIVKAWLQSKQPVEPETEQSNGKSKKAAECGAKRKNETSAEKREEREKRGKARNSTTKGQWE